MVDWQKPNVLQQVQKIEDKVNEELEQKNKDAFLEEVVDVATENVLTFVVVKQNVKKLLDIISKVKKDIFI